MTAPAMFRQADVMRAIKAAEKAGVMVGRIEIEPTGRIIILRDRGGPKRAANEWDAEFD